ncbi:MAG: hypothetical protein [Wigfec virus K19_177]|nr:MAG: hypothetical protein [Wigfec virus K19_177]
MSKRHKMTRNSSNKTFKKGLGTKALNLSKNPSRGGFRL